MANTFASFLTRLNNVLQGSSKRPSRYRSRYLPLIELLENRVAPAVYTWTGNGATQNWSDAQNWLHPQNGLLVVGAPSAGDEAAFPGLAAGPNANKDSLVDAAALPAPGGGPAAGTLATFSILNTYNGTITLGQNLTVTGNFRQFGGAVTGPFSLTITGTGSWTGGTESGDGSANSQLVVLAGADLQIYQVAAATNVTLDDRILDNSGTVQIGNATLAMNSFAIFKNEQSGSVLVTDDANQGATVITGGDEFVNYGLVSEAASSKLTINTPTTSYEGTFIAGGTITLGITTLKGGAPFPGQNSNLDGDGQMLIDGTLTVGGNTISNVKVLCVNGGAFIDADLALDNDDGSCTFGSNVEMTGDVDLNGEQANLIISANLVISGSTLTNKSITGGVTWNGGTITFEDNGEVSNSNGTFTITGAAQNMTVDGKFYNYAKVNVETSSTIFADFVNDGTVNLTGGTLTIGESWNQAATGTTVFLGGGLQVNGDFTNGGKVYVTTSGQLAVDTFENNGSLVFGPTPEPPPPPGSPAPPVRPAATLTVASRGVAGGGNYTQGGGTASLTVRIIDNTSIDAPGFSNDRLLVNRTATLAGILNVELPDGVNVNRNQSWTIITGGVQGQFAAPPNQPAGFSAPTYNNNSVVVQNPQMNACGVQTTNENVTFVFAPANTIPDPAAGTALLQISLSVSNGTLTLSSTSGLTFTSGTGTGDTSMTFVGMISDINAALAALSYLPNTNFFGSDTLSIVTTDTSASGGSFYDSDSVPITVVEGDTTTTVTASAPSITFGQSVTFTAVVSSVSPAAGTPTGTVNFLDGATVIGSGTLDSAGTTTFAITTLNAGSHTIYANYTGSDFNPSTSAGVSVAVNQADSTTTVSASSSSAVYGQTVTLSAAVDGGASGTPTGTVSFYDGGTLLGTQTLDGSGDASLAVSSLSVGDHSLTVSYSGDDNFSASSSGATDFTVSKNDTDISATASSNPAVVGQPITFGVSVDSYPNSIDTSADVYSVSGSLGIDVPTGSVTFYDGSVELGVATLDSSGHASIIVSSLSVGDHAISATYSGDANYLGSTSYFLPFLVDPTTTNDAEFSTGANAELSVAADSGLLQNNNDPYLSLQVTAINGTSGAVGTTIYTSNGGQLLVNADGSFSYTPSADFTGDDTFTYTIGDGNGNSSTATVTIHVG